MNILNQFYYIQKLRDFYENSRGKMKCRFGHIISSKKALYLRVKWNRIQSHLCLLVPLYTPSELREVTNIVRSQSLLIRNIDTGLCTLVQVFRYMCRTSRLHQKSLLKDRAKIGGFDISFFSFRQSSTSLQVSFLLKIFGFLVLSLK